MIIEIKAYVKTWEGRCYYHGISDEAPDEIRDKVPSYRRIAMAILKNDHCLKSLDFVPKKSKYYSILKRIEIEQRKTKHKQLKLNL